MIHLGHRLNKPNNGIGHKMGVALNVLGHKVSPMIGVAKTAIDIGQRAAEVHNILTRRR